MKPSRIAFEQHWLKTRGKRARNDLQRHPAQPQTYISDAANRHWVTWQAAQPDWQAAQPEQRVSNDFDFGADIELAYKEIYAAQNAELAKALAQQEQEPVQTTQTSIVFYKGNSPSEESEVLRITKEGITVNPAFQPDEAAAAVLRALDSQIKNLMTQPAQHDPEDVAFDKVTK